MSASDSVNILMWAARQSPCLVILTGSGQWKGGVGSGVGGEREGGGGEGLRKGHI